MKRQFGRDPGADNYGRHALRHPGGDNVQRDVLHVIGERPLSGYRIHPTQVREDYVGTHRTAGDGLGNWLFSVEATARRAGSNR